MDPADPVVVRPVAAAEDVAPAPAPAAALVPGPAPLAAPAHAIAAPAGVRRSSRVRQPVVHHGLFYHSDLCEEEARLREGARSEL